MTTKRTMAMLLAGAALVGACTPSPQTQRCRRLDVPSMGPENALSARVAADATDALDDPAERIDVALTAIVPWTGPASLVQKVDGREIARWSLSPPPSPAGIVQRCSIGRDAAGSTCGPALPAGAHPVAGEWTIEPNGNRILEASVSFRLCD